jgi:hypothetical protein
MQAHDIRARHERRPKATTDCEHDLPVALNLLDLVIDALCTAYNRRRRHSARAHVSPAQHHAA